MTLIWRILNWPNGSECFNGPRRTLVVMFLYVDTDDIRKHADKYQLEQRYASANTIAGIRVQKLGIYPLHGLLYFMRLCMCGSDDLAEDSLYPGTSKSAEGYGAEKVFAKAKEEGWKLMPIGNIQALLVQRIFLPATHQRVAGGWCYVDCTLTGPIWNN